MQNGKAVTQVNPNLPPALRSRIQQLHDDYTKAFRKDADTTVAEFNKMRDDLRKRYEALHGLDADATRSAQAEIVTLQRKRVSLYEQMVTQIEREVKIVAQQHGVAVVLSNVNATSGGVDLTDDAVKDIESLHE
jgi:hypothetical protein